VAYTAAFLGEPDVGVADLSGYPSGERVEKQEPRLTFVERVHTGRALFKEDHLYRNAVTRQALDHFQVLGGNLVSLASGITEAFDRTLDQRINRPQAVIDSDALALLKQCLLENKKRKVVVPHYSPDEVYENMNRKGALGIMSNATGKMGD
jgi:hypothetical protein